MYLTSEGRGKKNFRLPCRVFLQRNVVIKSQTNIIEKYEKNNNLISGDIEPKKAGKKGTVLKYENNLF